MDSLDSDSSSKNSAHKKVTKKSSGQASENSDLLHLAGKKAKATGFIDADGFVVCKGSDFYPKETKSCQKWIKDQRARLINENKVVKGKFVENVRFNSPSAAAACVTGGSANGNILWRHPDGESIKDKGEH